MSRRSIRKVKKVYMRPVCFWCGNDKHKVEAPSWISFDDKTNPEHRLYMDYTLCNKCLNAIGDGVIVAAVSEEKQTEFQFPINSNTEKLLYPTGTMVPLTNDIAKTYFALTDEDTQNTIFSEHIVFMPDDEVQKIIDVIHEAQGDTDENSGTELSGTEGDDAETDGRDGSEDMLQERESDNE